MIRGFVRDDEAIIRVKVFGPTGRKTEFEALIDTGFNGALTMPLVLIEALQLKWREAGFSELGDGSICSFEQYDGIVIWKGEKQKVTIEASDAMPLVGMALLHGYELKVQVRRRGKVTIRKLPRK